MNRSHSDILLARIYDVLERVAGQPQQRPCGIWHHQLPPRTIPTGGFTSSGIIKTPPGGVFSPPIELNPSTLECIDADEMV